MLPVSTLIAFGFSSPAMLAWLAAAAAPLVIHLFSRRRYRQVPWAAMQQLAAAMRQSRRRMQFEQLLLLAVRSLIIVLVVTAVAGPCFDQDQCALKSGTARTHRILVLDASYSMSCTDSYGKSRFEKARSLARRLVENSPAGDCFSLLLMGTPPQVVVGTPAFESAAFLAVLDTVDTMQTSFDLPATLKRIEGVLAAARRTTPGIESAAICFFTDLGKVGWQPEFAGPASESAFRRRLARLAEAASLTVVDIGRGDVENHAVSDIRIDGSLATVAKPLEITATLRNFGPRGRSNFGVELWIDSRRTDKRNVALPAGAAATASFSHRFSAAGEHVVEIRTAADRLPLDDRRWLSLPVKSCLQVLCVDGNPAGWIDDAEPPSGGARTGGACAYLAVALAAEADKNAPPRVCPRVIAESDLMETDLKDYDCVFICNVAQFTAGEVIALGRYAQEGGALVFFLGDRVLPDRYNRRLAADNAGGTPLLPARLAGLVETGPEGLDPLDYRHPIVEKFRGRELSGLLNTPVSKLFRLSLDEGSKANVVLATRAGDPLIVERAVGRGRVVLVATSADMSWGAMPVWPSFVPLVHEILDYAVGGQIADRNRLVGDVLDGPVPDNAPLLPSAGLAVQVQTPHGTTCKANVAWRDDRPRWNFGTTGTSGIYKVFFAAAGTEKSSDLNTRSERQIEPGLDYAVNLDTVESDLTKLSQQQLRDGPLAGAAFEYRTDLSSSEATTVGRMTQPASLSAALLWIVFALLLLEVFVAWRFGHQLPSDGVAKAIRS